jgi:hypothetical protein
MSRYGCCDAYSARERALAHLHQRAARRSAHDLRFGDNRASAREARTEGTSARAPLVPIKGRDTLVIQGLLGPFDQCARFAEVNRCAQR